MRIVKKIRLALGGISQREFGELLGVHNRTIYFWEKNDGTIPSLTHVFRLWKIIEERKLADKLELNYEKFCKIIMDRS